MRFGSFLGALFCYSLSCLNSANAAGRCGIYLDERDMRAAAYNYDLSMWLLEPRQVRIQENENRIVQAATRLEREKTLSHQLTSIQNMNDTLLQTAEIVAMLAQNPLWIEVLPKIQLNFVGRFKFLRSSAGEIRNAMMLIQILNQETARVQFMFSNTLIEYKIISFTNNVLKLGRFETSLNPSAENKPYETITLKVEDKDLSILVGVKYEESQGRNFYSGKYVIPR